MGILKRIFVLFVIAGLFCLAISYFTGDGSFLSVGGMVSVAVGFFCLYIAYKLLWSIMGVYLRLVLAVLICWAVFYLLGKFVKNDDVQIVSASSSENADAISEDLKDDDLDLLAARQMIAAAGQSQLSAEKNEQTPSDTVELFVDESLSSHKNVQNNAALLQTEKSGFWDKLKSLFGHKEQDEKAQREIYNNINPFDYPMIKGYPRVVRGSVLYLNGYYLRLYGIEAPYPNQTCADGYGRSYACGTRAMTWLQDWLNNREVSCYVLGEVQNGWATAICMVDDGKYDLAAIVTNAGWAVAYTKNTDVYVPYEKKAAKARRGLWKGSFYKPWDWYKIQTRKVDIKIKSSKDNGGFDFWGLF